MTSEPGGTGPEDARQVALSVGDPDQFGAVFDRYFAEIHGYAAKRRGRDVADDVAAETFLTAFRARHRYVTGGTAGNFVRTGPATDPYVVLELDGSQYWAARSPKDGSPLFAQPLGAQLASPADQAAWRRDGSPTVWPDTTQKETIALPNGLPISGSNRPLHAAPGKLSSMTARYGAQQFQVGNQSLTLSQLQAPPADPARLKALILNGWTQSGPATKTRPVTSCAPWRRWCRCRSRPPCGPHATRCWLACPQW